MSFIKLTHNHLPVISFLVETWAIGLEQFRDQRGELSKRIRLKFYDH